MRIFAVVNQKGGCGKTTTAINLSGVFAAKGFRTLLVDLDPQGHCAAGLAIPEQRVDLTIGDAMLAADDQPVDPKRLLWRVSRNLDLAPSTVRLAALEAGRGELAARGDPERRLQAVLARFDGQYDVVLIDCSPAIGLLAFNAMVAANEVIIPVETGFFSLQGATKQINAIKSIGKRLGVAPSHRLLATMHDPSSALSQDLLDELRRRFGARVLPSVIRYDQSLREAASFGQPVIEYAPDSTGAADYSSLAEYLIEHAVRPSRAEAIVPVTPSVPQLTLGPEADALARVVQGWEDTRETPRQSPVRPSADTAAATLTRQLDLVMRAQRLHQPSSVSPRPENTSTNAAGFAENKPTHDLFGVPISPTSGSSSTLVSSTRPIAGSETIGNTPPVADGPRSHGNGVGVGFGVTPVDDGVMLRVPVALGSEVAVAGDFNGWKPERSVLGPSSTPGVLEARVQCPPGAYQYRLVIDGVWMPDPYNPVLLANPFGGSNSVAIVPPRQANAPARSAVELQSTTHNHQRSL